VRGGPAEQFMTSETNKEMFLALLSEARENHEERRKILSILELESTRRKIAINILVTNMRLQKAPQAFIDAWDSLQDDAVAESAKRVIEDHTLDERTNGWSAIIMFVLAAGGVVFLCFLYSAVFR
jgi:hypothetical protein